MKIIALKCNDKLELQYEANLFHLSSQKSCPNDFCPNDKWPIKAAK